MLSLDHFVTLKACPLDRYQSAYAPIKKAKMWHNRQPSVIA